MKIYKRKDKEETSQTFTKALLTADVLNIGISGWYIIFYWSRFQEAISPTFIKVWFTIWAVIAVVLIIKYTIVRYKPEIRKAAKKIDKDDIEDIAKAIYKIKEDY